MEVILRRHVENVGQRGEVVKVADGFARNYLLPRRLAFRVTPGNLKHVERERARVEAQETEERQAAEAVGARLSGVDIVMTRKVGETQALYGSVTAADLAAALAEHGLEIDRRKVLLAEPIKRLGEYEVPVKLHRDVVAPLKVRVVAEGARDQAEPTETGTPAEADADASAETDA